jgi:arginyl-tRNA synthetase
VEEIKRDPIKVLLDVCVKANALADEDPEFAVKARNEFCALENRDQDNLDIWEMCRVFTIKELEKNYLKLNLTIITVNPFIVLTNLNKQSKG